MTTDRFDGEFEGVEDAIARGWALRLDTPEETPLVEILCEDFPVAFDRANIFRPDLEDRLDHPGAHEFCVGFEIAIPDLALQDGGRFQARIANTDMILRPSNRAPAKAARDTAIRGEVTANGALLLSGWAARQDLAAGPIRLQALENGAPLMDFDADGPIPASGLGKTSAHARTFRVRLPLRLADGNIHRIEIVDETGLPLRGSPVTVAAWSDGVSHILDTHLPKPADPARTNGHASELLALRTAFEKAALTQPAAARFEDYPDWVAAYPPAAKATDALLEITVFVFGDDDPDETIQSIEAQPKTPAVHLVPDGILTRDLWPEAGLVFFVRAGDTLHPAACAALAPYLDNHLVAYSDSDQRIGTETLPWMKPDWDPDLFMTQGYIYGLLGVRADAVKLSASRLGLAKAVIRALNDAGDKVAHCPEVLYHQRQAAAFGAAPVPSDWLRQALETYDPVARRRPRISAYPERPFLTRITWPLPETPPKVSIVIPTRDRVDLLKTAVETLWNVTRYPDIEVIVVDNGSVEQETLQFLNYFMKSGGRVVPSPGRFNFSRLNNIGVAHAAGEIICLLNNDVEIIASDWLSEMVTLLLRPGTGAVGAKLLWPNGMVQHGGVVLGIDGGAAHIGNAWADEDPGYAALNQVVRRTACATAACLVLRKDDYHAVGGLDEEAFPVAFNDVDLCLKLEERGKHTVWTPHAKLLHHESASRGTDDWPEKAARARRELNNLRQRWGKALLNDSLYSPNLNKDRAPYEGLALPPRRRPLETGL
ncbi:MAG: glycosyltransferase [Roseibium sp.]|nr:glycosyltransferase [Roseibium sp.]